MLKTEGQYVFILCPNHSGSTVLYFLLSTSKEVSTMNWNNNILEGQIIPDVMDYMPYAKESDKGLFYLHKEKHQDETKYNWEKIKSGWRKHWDYSKSVLLEKSTTNLYRKKMLQDNFKNAKFIIMVRNPYAVCEGIKRKHGVDVVDAAEHWLDTAEQQIKNISEDSVFFTYEQLCDCTDTVVNKILEYAPEFVFLDYKSKLNRPRYEKIIGLQNMNDNQIKSLSKLEIKKISSKLSNKKEVVDFYGYNIL